MLKLKQKALKPKHPHTKHTSLLSPPQRAPAPVPLRFVCIPVLGNEEQELPGSFSLYQSCFAGGSSISTSVASSWWSGGEEINSSLRQRFSGLSALQTPCLMVGAAVTRLLSCSSCFTRGEHGRREDVFVCTVAVCLAGLYCVHMPVLRSDPAPSCLRSPLQNHSAGEVWHCSAGCSCQENQQEAGAVLSIGTNKGLCLVSALSSAQLCPCSGSGPRGHPRGCCPQVTGLLREGFSVCKGRLLAPSPRWLQREGSKSVQ